MTVETLSVNIAPTVDRRAARFQLALAVSRILRERGEDPARYALPVINDGLASRAMAGETVTVEVHRG